MWEKFTKRWKTLSGRLCEALDIGYENYSRHGGPAKEKIEDVEVRSYTCGAVVFMVFLAF